MHRAHRNGGVALYIGFVLPITLSSSLRWMVFLGVCAFMVAALMVAFAGPRSDRPLSRWSAASHGREAAAAGPLVPLPAVEPLILVETTPDDARKTNAAVPFARGELIAARPLIFAGNLIDRERALTCLASATWYEAGDDAIGQRAVAQVVLNRLRHPAYPKTVCGVVFQGSERQTGCQFTFACDGAMTRTPSADAWTRARAIAKAALGGVVDKTVGTATHYHTDWVVPYWSASLDKIAQVHTHLFFRWRGWWGQPAAFSGRYAGNEVLDPRLLRLAGPDAKAAALAAAVMPTARIVGMFSRTDPRTDLGINPRINPLGFAGRDLGVPDLKGNVIRLAAPARTEFALQLDPKAFPGSYAIVAYSLCKTKPVCKVSGWLRAAQVPAALPIPAAALRTMSFVYRKDTGRGPDEFQWNCGQIARQDKSQCLPES